MPASRSHEKAPAGFPTRAFSICYGRPAKPADFRNLHLDGRRLFHELWNYLWLLSRTPQLPAADIERALNAAAGQGYDLKQFKYTRHTESTQ